MKDNKKYLLTALYVLGSMLSILITNYDLFLMFNIIYLAIFKRNYVFFGFTVITLLTNTLKATGGGIDFSGLLLDILFIYMAYKNWDKIYGRTFQRFNMINFKPFIITAVIFSVLNILLDISRLTDPLFIISIVTSYVSLLGIMLFLFRSFMCMKLFMGFGVLTLIMNIINVLVNPSLIYNINTYIMLLVPIIFTGFVFIIYDNYKIKRVS